MNSEKQQRRARKNCGKLYQKLLNDYDLIIDNEKFLKLSVNNVLGKRYFYSTDPFVAPPNIRFQQKTKFESCGWRFLQKASPMFMFIEVNKLWISERMYQSTITTIC